VNAFARWSAGLTRVAEFLVIFAFAGMGVAIMGQICLRSLGLTLLAMEDIAFFGCFWLVFSGMAVAFRRGAHVTVDLVVEYLPHRVREVVERIALGLILLFLALFTWSGIRLTLDNVNQYAMQLRISVAYVYFVLPLGGCISLVIVLERLLVRFRPRGGIPR
jgi:TRAP-type C4-dicarboxylate transport system permease small subunit